MMLKPFYTQEEVTKHFGINVSHEYLALDKVPAKEMEQRLDGCFFYSLVWSICCSVTGEYRITLNQKFKKILIGDLVKGVKI
jgi:dynein heavy chain, axonemal